MKYLLYFSIYYNYKEKGFFGLFYEVFNVKKKWNEFFKFELFWILKIYVVV